MPRTFSKVDSDSTHQNIELINLNEIERFCTVLECLLLSSSFYRPLFSEIELEFK